MTDFLEANGFNAIDNELTHKNNYYHCLEIISKLIPHECLNTAAKDTFEFGHPMQFYLKHLR